MASGGYRPGAGRKPGSKNKKTAASAPAAIVSEQDREKIRALLAVNLEIREKAKKYSELLAKKGKGEISGPELREMDGLRDELERAAQSDNSPHENLLPLDYMLKVMNDPTEDKDMRARMAIAAAPFIHARLSDGKGKKDEREEKAKKAGSGKFSPSKPPIALVK